MLNLWVQAFNLVRRSASVGQFCLDCNTDVGVLVLLSEGIEQHGEEFEWNSDVRSPLSVVLCDEDWDVAGVAVLLAYFFKE